MLFHSQLFLAVFLPVCLGAFWVLHRYGASGTILKILLLLFSWAFYAYWDVRLFTVLPVSIAVNYLIVFAIGHNPRLARLGAIAALLFNLGLLGYFKYTLFFAETASWLLGLPEPRFSIILPLGISFFTFQQISYLVDYSKGKAPQHSLLDYALYVSYFPQLVAGPIVRHNQLIPQFAHLGTVTATQVSSGLVFLVIGIAKKVLLADQMERLVNPVFAASEQGAVTLADAWTGIGGFVFQIYFDFSAYSDMAIGLALLFGLTLPINFASPYKASSLNELWRGWHITLTSFLRDYLFLPIALRLRHMGEAARYIALFLTMLLAGLWHGAGWTFVIWGGANGLAMCLNTLWRRSGYSMPKLCGWALTMLFWTLSAPFFRGTSLDSALTVFTASLGFGSGGTLVTHWDDTAIAAMLAAAAVAFLAPNTQQIAGQTWWRNAWGGVAFGIAFVVLFFHVGGGHQAEFIYFQF